jgi:hypothetical protein
MENFALCDGGIVAVPGVTVKAAESEATEEMTKGPFPVFVTESVSVTAFPTVTSPNASDSALDEK